MDILAYVDPGSGLLLWQSLVAACVGLLFYLKKTRHWMADMARKALGRSKRSAPTPQPNPEAGSGRQ